MYTNVWNKYLPVIKILLKKSKGGEQLLNLNISDFERAGVARKSGYKFNIVFQKGKIENVIIASPLASNLATLMLQDPVIKDIFSQGDYQINMNTKFQLAIRHIPLSDLAEEPVAEMSETERA